MVEAAVAWVRRCSGDGKGESGGRGWRERARERRAANMRATKRGSSNTTTRTSDSGADLTATPARRAAAAVAVAGWDGSAETGEAGLQSPVAVDGIDSSEGFDR